MANASVVISNTGKAGRKYYLGVVPCEVLAQDDQGCASVMILHRSDLTPKRQKIVSLNLLSDYPTTMRNLLRQTV